jgi:RNA polymerase sigma factor (sigma-70 family)
LLAIASVDFDATFDELYPPLVRYCHRLTGDSDVAEDVAQEALVRLFTHEVDGPTPALRVWAFKTATHLVRDRYRVEENRKRLLQANPVSPTPTERPDRRLERKEERERVRSALEALSPRDREILLMRYEGFSYKDVAEAVGVASTSVGTLLARAERRLASALADMETVA